MQVLDARIAAVGNGPDENFLARLSRLIVKYNIRQPSVQVRGGTFLRTWVAPRAMRHAHPRLVSNMN